MTYGQYASIGILVVLLGLFIWGRWRYDVVAFLALIVAVAIGIVPVESAFSGFSNNAVITVALVLVLSAGLQNSGAIDLATRYLIPPGTGPIALLVLLPAAAAVLSAFLNNVGALAILMPVAIVAAQRANISPAILLMPVSFGSILGGMSTLIGTPPNIILAEYRARALGEPFGMFDYSPVGIGVAVAGVLFVGLIGWRLLPKERQAARPPEELFEIAPYVTEARLGEKSKLVDQPVREASAALSEIEAEIIGLVRGEKTILNPGRWERLRAGDGLVLRADADAIRESIRSLGLELVGEEEIGELKLDSEEVALVEAVVMPKSSIVGRSVRELYLRRRYGLNLLAVSRAGRRIHSRLNTLRFAAGDVLLLQGDRDRMGESLNAMGCAPLAARAIEIRRPLRAGLAVASFGAAIALAASGTAPVSVAFAAAVLVYVLSGIISAKSAYESIDWSVIVLLGALIPIGQAVDQTGSAALVANGIVLLFASGGEILVLAAVLAIAMLLSDVLNNAAVAVIMAPIAVSIAQAFGVNPDTFLMAVAIGASCAFLTPIGHQNNVLIMGPGGYRFGDYWRMGLPLEVIVVAVGLPLLLWAWPL
ncbi:MAG: SLC13 family permease [Dongiaceae bacterium]